MGQAGDRDLPSFIPAASFGGARKDMVFKQGPKGQGYYADSAEPGVALDEAVLAGQAPARRQKNKRKQQTAPVQTGGSDDDEMTEATLQPATGRLD